MVEIGTVAFEGIQAVPITVQVQIAGGFLPSFSIVGLPDKSVSEAKDRIRSALYSLGLSLPAKRITVNLSPASIQKEGTHYDLPIALGILMAMEVLSSQWLSGCMALGEISLDASLKPVRGVLSASLLAASMNRVLICPEMCGGEAAWGGDLEIVAPNHLLSLMDHVRHVKKIPPPVGQIQKDPPAYVGDFADVKGQEHAKRALLISCSGRHNILMSGPAGVGKSMLASRMISIMPQLSPEESLEVTMVHSMANRLHQGQLLRYPPFRKPHHSISVPALVGGGFKGMPGEVSLAHRGVLFLDELPEFSRYALESLRQPLENKEVVVSRVHYRATYPAHFQLVAAMNPCRCGYLGDPKHQCPKAPGCGILYQQSLSVPFLDRIDLFVDIPKPDFHQIASRQHKPDENVWKSEIMREKVKKAWEFRHWRKGSIDDPLPALEEDVKRNFAAYQDFMKAVSRFQLSMRSYFRTLRLARTIADLEENEVIQKDHLYEALSYRFRHQKQGGPG